MYSIGQLSKKTGVTVRTLDYYDEIGLITPSSKTEGGHRLYSDDDVMRLEQVLALKFMGFSLQQIQEVLDRPTATWEDSLEKQLKMIRQQQKQLKELERAVQSVLYSVQFEDAINWAIIFEIIQMFKQSKESVQDLFEHYFNPNEYKEIQDMGKRMDEQDLQEWQDIYHDVRANIHVHPGSDTAQRLARRWMDKVDEMFAGNKEIEAKMWHAMKDHKDDITFYPIDKDMVNFIDSAVTIMYQENDQNNNRSKREAEDE
ncbi:MerR family transcriptional regulator [Pseudogracilibacillus auburnensis]|uniref:DNA-binding transcriptional MerR regulator n=1 Tax=Pseudogracilibacillus auburnensis TaxID=1494959 RepID=A0A2V3WAX0_9BACI|nr:MerR family transcriptional regulator [Pseudogracilibacillus auburnensis]PXW90676.1 DNA-binding transcriptional MerR regulator [Pseudogracilibacillus auburnensis]